MAQILLVDDETSNLEVATVICEAAGHQVTVARDGHEALALIASQRFQLVLMDLLMPHCDGLAATRAIRANPAYARLPILGVTALTARTDHRAMLAAGMNAVLTKPYRNKQLLQAIADALQAPELTLLIASAPAGEALSQQMLA